MARTNINAFIEYVGKDSKGVKVVQAQIHQEIQKHIDLCKSQGFQNCGILAPWGHGKTEQVSIFRTLDEIGKDKNIRTQIICNSDDNAAARVNTISNYLENDPDYHAVHPDIRPGIKDGDDWGKHKLVVERDSRSKDGTVEAYGVTTSGTGSRADLQIFDDPVDMRNAILNPALRKQVKDSIKNVWLSRLVPGGFRIYIATVWHADDYTSEIIKSKEWKFLVMRVSEDFKYIECDSSFKGKYTIPLWSVWNEVSLKAQFNLLGQRAFNRGYRQQALSDEDMTFPHYEQIFNWDLDRSFVGKDWARCIGIDPFGKQVVIFVLALNPLTRQRVPIEIRRGKWDPKRTITEIRDSYITHMPQIIVCENNASQEAIVQWAQELGWGDMPIIPFTTGAQKANPEMGLPSLDVEFANGTWVVPMQGVDKFDTENVYNIWKHELKNHPIGEAADTVMAMWFAREGARYLLKRAEEGDPDETVTQDQVLGNEARVQIGAY